MPGSDFSSIESLVVGRLSSEPHRRKPLFRDSVILWLTQFALELSLRGLATASTGKCASSDLWVVCWRGPNSRILALEKLRKRLNMSLTLSAWFFLLQFSLALMSPGRCLRMYGNFFCLGLKGQVLFLLTSLE